MRRLARVATVLVVGVGVMAMSSTSTPLLADQSSPAVVAEQQRITDLLNASLAGSAEAATHEPLGCDVKVLRMSGETAWALTTCAVPDGGDAGSAISGERPIRVDGDSVTFPSTGPEDASAYESYLRRNFPSDLVPYVMFVAPDRGAAHGER